MTLRAYRESLHDLEETEDLMGEVASLLSDVADALSENPQGINLSEAERPHHLAVSAREWPTYASLSQLIARWNEQHTRLEKLWADLADCDRGNLASPWQRGSSRLKPLV